MPKRTDLEVKFTAKDIYDTYKDILSKNANKINHNAKNIEKIAIVENYTVGDSVKTMFRELVRKKHFTFNKLFSLKRCKPQEVVTAFSGLLEMSRRSKVNTKQDELFGEIEVNKKLSKLN